jgi:hypothetical protein
VDTLKVNEARVNGSNKTVSKNQTGTAKINVFDMIINTTKTPIIMMKIAPNQPNSPSLTAISTYWSGVVAVTSVMPMMS